ncbi:MAG: hypothetical protein WA956_07620 [Stenotrophomonas sp.]
MNAKSIAIALAIATTGFATTAQAADIVTLETVQVRPSADQHAQAERERNSNIPTLSLVQVRPSVGQIVELAAEQAAMQVVAGSPLAIGASVGQWMVSLPAITVRPDAQQVRALAAAAKAGLNTDSLGQVAQGMIAK